MHWKEGKHGITSIRIVANRCLCDRFGIWNFVFRHIYVILLLIRDSPGIGSGGNQSIQQKPPPNPKSLVTFSHTQGPVSRIAKYESFQIYDFLNLGTSLRRSVVAFLEALRK